jgi:HPt (histidine-containing phosphotransfer) domain-containing protein
MRMIVIKQDTDLQALSGKLLASTPNATGPTLDRIKALNPHIDLQRIAAGSVLLLPDSPSLNHTETQPVGGDTFNTFTTTVTNGFEASVKGMQTDVSASADNINAVKEALSTPTIKRMVESDASLQQQFDQASKQLTAEQAQAQAAVTQIQALQRQVIAELATLGKWFK